MAVVMKACFSFSTPFQRWRGCQLCALRPRVWPIPPDSGWGTVPRHRGRQEDRPAGLPGGLVDAECLSGPFLFLISAWPYLFPVLDILYSARAHACTERRKSLAFLLFGSECSQRVFWLNHILYWCPSGSHKAKAVVLKFMCVRFPGTLLKGRSLRV